MKVLVACEYSGVVRSAFAALGADAWSCDLLPTEKPGQHIIDDVRNVLDFGWDLMIAHPPCTYLSYAANHVWNEPGRELKREYARQLFLACYNAPIPHICIENPVGYMNTVFRKPDQIVHPYYFGDRDLKKTCFWLKNLPKLGFMKFTEYPEPVYVDKTEKAKKRYFSEAPQNIGNGHGRSRTFPGIAQAMANQWHDLSTQPVQYSLFEDAS